MHTIIPAEKNQVLREIAREVPLGDITGTRIRTLISDMKKLLAQEKYGVALAAPQVGDALRLFVISGRALRKHDDEDTDTLENFSNADLSRVESRDEVYINPVMTKVSRRKSDKHEGCLSIRGKWGQVPRAEKATIRAFDEKGRSFTRGASGFLAHIFQHEMDHLEGILYTDRAKEMYDEKENDHEE